jgi:hypothetical protein
MTGMAETHGIVVQQLGRLEPVDPRSVWSHEALNFTPWLAQNADRLAEALGIELEVEATEYASMRSAVTRWIFLARTRRTMSC